LTINWAIVLWATSENEKQKLLVQDNILTRWSMENNFLNEIENAKIQECCSLINTKL
jgi:hypothetical protein